MSGKLVSRVASFIGGALTVLLVGHFLGASGVVRVPSVVTASVPSPSQGDAAAAALKEVRLQTQAVKALLQGSATVERELAGALTAVKSAASAPIDDVTAAADGGAKVSDGLDAAVEPHGAGTQTTSCPSGCTRHGNCDALTGKCSCPPTFRGAACDVPTMPSCATVPTGEAGDEDGYVNLSGMASEQFWWMLRDIRPNPKDDERRRSPPFRWVGVVTCDCVREAVGVFSLQQSPEPAAWPRYIGLTELGMQFVACVDAADGQTVGALWSKGGTTTEGPLPWSYVPVVAWLKPYPAHSPMLLPNGIVTERDYVKPTDKHLMYLKHKDAERALQYAPPPPPPRPLGKMLPTMGRIHLYPTTSCGAHRCHHAGWCGIWKSASFQTPVTCHCLSEWTKDTHAIRMTTHNGRHNTWEGPENAIARGRRQRRIDAAGGGSGATCARAPRVWEPGMERARYARTPEAMAAHDAEHSHFGSDRWTSGHPTIPRSKACPNECLGRGNCSYGFCHCREGFWGLDCGLSAARLAELGRARAQPRIYVYEVPAALRRSCAPWTLPEDLGDRLLLSKHLEPNPERADVFWVYGCPNGDTVLPMLRWVKRAHPFWSAAVRAGQPRHVMAVGHEEGWSEVWQLLGRWLGPNFDHSNHGHGWDDLHPASPTRQIAAIQLHGGSDYTADGKPRRRGVSGGASCRVCFQPGKDVVVPGFPGIMDYPDDHGRPALYKLGGTTSGRVSQCRRIAVQVPYEADGKTLSPRSGKPAFFMAGVVQTKSHGPGLYEASRLVPYNCWKNRSKENGFLIRQTETVTVSVSPWEIEQPVDPYPAMRHSSLCAVPEGKIGSYGHRSTNALMLGCVPIFTKELYSYPMFHEVIDWRKISLHVPPAEMPKLLAVLNRADVEALRRAGGPIRRRLLWTSIYGNCHFRDGEGGDADAFDTLMEVLRKPRRHFELSSDHKAPRAPEMLDELYPWLRQRGGEACTHGYQCFDEHRRSCYEKYTVPNP